MESIFNKLKLRLPAIGMLAVTFLVWPAIDPCSRVGEALLDHPGLGDAASHIGECSESNTVIHIRQTSVAEHPEVTFDLGDISGYKIIRLSGYLQAGPVSDMHAGHSVVLRLDEQAADGSLIQGKWHQLKAAGTLERSFFIQDYVIDDATVNGQVVLTRHGLAGIAAFDSIQALPMKWNAVYPWYRWMFILGWLVMGVVYFRNCRLHQRPLRYLILLNAAVILVGVMLPTHWIQYGPGFLRWLSLAEPGAAPLTQSGLEYIMAGFGNALFEHLLHTIVQSRGHFILFGTLAMLVFLSGALEGKGMDFFPRATGDLLLFGAVTESLQFFAVERTVDMVDMLCNTYGILAALMLFMILKKIWSSLGWKPVGSKN